MEWVLLHLGLVDRDAEPWLRIRPHDPALRLDRETLLHHIGAPRHIGMDRLANRVAGLAEADLQARRRTDWPLRVVRRKRDAMRLGQSSDTPGFGEAAAMRDVYLTNLTGAGVEEIAERREVGHPLAGGDWR